MLFSVASRKRPNIIFAILRSITKKVEYQFAIFRSTTEKTESCQTCNSYVYIAVINWCRDKDGLNCWRYVDAKCLGFYEDWARENCPYRCGYCPSMNCKTKIIGAYICILAPTQVGQGYSLQIKIYRSKPKPLTYTYMYQRFTFNRSNSFIIQDKRKICISLLTF